MSRLSIGLVGAGWMGEALLRRLGERDDVEIAWVVSRNLDRARGLLGELGLSRARVSTDYQQMLADAQVRAIFIASPNSFHGQQSIAAMQA
ncbi:MAG TPA: Gfo/Idh/MocA family oxidoreductase, partial [Tepidisphaeraceae bacterium]|nr:Gfo/Idh/MocA family oxidoreductase [Tepidisphaeraceae bacterium]